MVEVLRIDRRVAGVEVGGLQQPLNNQGHVAPEFLLNLC